MYNGKLVMIYFLILGLSYGVFKLRGSNGYFSLMEAAK